MWMLIFCYLRKINSTWKIVYVFIACIFVDRIHWISCEFSDSTELFTMAIVNVTYVDPVSNKLHTEKAEIGRYGPFRIDASSGLVLNIRNKKNDSACYFTSENEIPRESWIALIHHNSCPLFDKIIFCQNSNASAVVVYHEQDTKSLRNINVHNMIVISITREKGEEIASLVENGTRVYMYITVGYIPPRPNINRTSVLFVSISFIVLMIISLAWLVFYYVQRFRYIHAKDQLARRLCNAAKKALAKIPEKNIREMEGDLGCCAVCIECYEPTDVVRTLPCKHIFHKKCVDPWLLDQRTCPMCKMDILEYFGLMFNSQDSVLHVDIEEPVASSVEEDNSSGILSVQERRPTSSVSINNYVEAYLEPNDFSNIEDESKSRQSVSSINETWMGEENTNAPENVQEDKSENKR